MTQNVPLQTQPKPINQFDLSNIVLNVNVESQNVNTHPANLQPQAQADSFKKANILMNPTGNLNEEFDNFQTANTQEKKQSSVFIYLFIN